MIEYLKIEWPEGLGAIAEILGDEIAWELVSCCPGIRLDIPKTDTQHNYAFMQLSETTRQKLRKEFGGDRFYIPKFENERNEAIAAAIEVMSVEGCSYQEIALKLGLTETRIWQIKSARASSKTTSGPTPRQDPRQKSLF